ncbi:MAG: hypothetical protein DHS20C14_17650 [Phycisphaeraceae bacterium]|nr:MAG: hypothetical protein DHS20C14_17650 [Phycisphaeraceae bacterium]
MATQARTIPAPAPEPASLPSAVTFFMNAGDRARVLAALRAIDRDRVRALMSALKLNDPPTDQKA